MNVLIHFPQFSQSIEKLDWFGFQMSKYREKTLTFQGALLGDVPIFVTVNS
jgi:hypothetical protein